MFCTRVAWACLVCLLLCKEEGSSPVSLQLLRGGIWACINNINNIIFYSANIQLGKNLFNALYKIACVQVDANYYI